MQASATSSIVKDRWILKKKVGKGTFCEMFLGRSIIPFDSEVSLQVAIKLQTEDIDKNIMRTECEILKALSGLKTVPQFLKAGKHENRDFMVMELLAGEDMAHMRDRIRKQTGMRVLALPGAIYLAKQMLGCIRGIHSRGFVHRDIKPSNFIRRTQNGTEFVMVDFGITKVYREQNAGGASASASAGAGAGAGPALGDIRPERDGCEFRGTAQYASPFAHEGKDQCPRDDLLGLLLVFFDLVCGKLPWLEAVKLKDRAAVTESKRYFFSDPAKLTSYVRDIAQAETQNKAPDVLSQFDNFPALAQEKSLLMIKYLMGLKYEAVPDYGQIEAWFETMLTEEERSPGHPCQWARVSHPSYSFHGFNWSGGADKRVDERERLSSDPGVLQEIACARMRYLSKLLIAFKDDCYAKLHPGAAGSGSNSGSGSGSHGASLSSSAARKRSRSNAEESGGGGGGGGGASGRSSPAVGLDDFVGGDRSRAGSECQPASAVAGSCSQPDGSDGTEPEPENDSLPRAGGSAAAAASYGAGVGGAPLPGQNTPVLARSSGSSRSDSSGVEGAANAPSASLSLSASSASSRKPPTDAFPEMRSITPHIAVARLWSLVVGELQSVQRHHVHADRIAEIHKIWSEKHACFADLMVVHVKAAGNADAAAALAGTPYDPAAPVPAPPAPPAPPGRAQAQVDALQGQGQGQGQGQASGVYAGQSLTAVAEAVWAQSVQVEEANRLFRGIARSHGVVGRA